MSVRDQLVTLLTPKIPAGWKLIPYQDNVDTLDTPTVMFKQMTIENASEAPQGNYLFGYTLTIIDGTTDPQVAEANLDDEVETLWVILDGMSQLNPKTATKVLFQSDYLAYDITVDIITAKDAS